MEKYTVTIGNRIRSNHWTPHDMTWQELVDVLKVPVRTKETVAEYQAADKESKTRYKDHGGFVGGDMIPGRRILESVKNRSLITLDVEGDGLTMDILEDVISRIDHKAAIYSTHSHIPEAPRLRFVVPMIEPIPPESYEPVSRFYADHLGIFKFTDKASWRCTQIMLWPSCPADGYFLSREIPGPVLDWDFLPIGWERPECWPKSEDEAVPKVMTNRHRVDPRTKDGVVGDFCRKFTVEQAIMLFLGHMYRREESGRYTYIPGTSSAGLHVDEPWCWSYQNTDPANNGSRLNAFELCMVHLFPNDFRSAAEWARHQIAFN